MSEREVSPLEDKLLGQAVANTENEIFRSAMDVGDPDEAEEGDRSREEMGEGLEGQHEPDEAEDDSDEAAEGEPKEGDDEADDAEADRTRDDKGRFVGEKPEAPKDKGNFVPRARLTEEANKRREAEETAKTERDKSSKLETDIQALNRRFDEMLQRMGTQPAPVQQPKTEPVAPPTKPDMFTDPEGYEKWVLAEARSNATQEASQIFVQRFVEASMADAHDTHGEEFVKAYEALTGINPVTQQVVRQVDKNDPMVKAEVARVLNAPNPGKALMSWSKRQATLQRVGTDPDKFEESIRTQTREALMKDPEFRKQMLADLRAEAAQGDNGRPRTRFPKSIGDAAGGSSAQTSDPRAFDDSEEGVFENVWSDRKAG